MTTARIRSFFDTVTFTATHVVSCPVTSAAAVIDSVLDFDLKSGQTSTEAAERVLVYVRENSLDVHWHLETHAHADHFSAAPYLKMELGGRIGIGIRICEVQKVFQKIFNVADLTTDGAQFDHLFEDGEIFHIGEVEVRVLHTPGHTPACVTYVIGEDAFVGDTLFMPDYGSARCDFPGGDARILYQSIRKVLALPGATRLHLCHDYRPGGREALWLTTVSQQRAHNVHVHDGVSEEVFVEMRTARDKTLSMPALMFPAVQVNVRAGHFPSPEDNGTCYLKIPLNTSL
jgi:glyoxylase-like metal-dependent hydrolase (beta-lactamase superfamily II)